MPNHVTTICTVTGPAADVAAFVENRIGRTDKGEPFFDFDRVIAKPLVVQETTAGSQAEVGLYALGGPKKTFDGPLAKMFPEANDENPSLRWRYLPPTVDTREKLLAHLKEHDPKALEQGEKALRCLKETGYPDWYEWSIANWGTKWGAYDYEERERADGRFVFKFETAWSFPEPIFRRLATLHPTLTFDIASFDEGWCFGAVGQFNGRGDYRAAKELATEALYERVYGRKPDSDEEDDGGSETGSTDRG